MLFRPTMKSFKAFAAAAFASAAIFGGSSQAQDIDWNYLRTSPVRFEAGGTAGDQPGVQDGFYRTGVFTSIFEDADSILFLDGHGNVNYDSGNWSGDVGLGYRKDVGMAVLGGNAYYNYREYSNGINEHNFHTLGFGGEALMADWAIRSNAYVSVSGRQSNGRTAFGLLGGPDLVPQVGGSMGVENIRLATQTENFDEALDGFDLTVSRKVPSVRSEFSAGVYYLTAGGGPESWGVTGGADLWLTPNMAGSVNVSNDDLFDTTVYGGFSIYFGGPAIDANTRAASVRSRLWSRVQRRHVAPVLNYTNAAPDLLATDATTGDLITVARIAMGGDLLNAPNLLEDDGEFIDIILVDPDAAFTPMDTIALNDNQRLLSAHLLHQVDTAEVGLIDLPQSGLGGGPASLTGPMDTNVVTLANNNEVSGFMLTGTGSGAGIAGQDITGFNLNNNIITSATGGGIDIDSSGLTDISGVIVDNMITGVGNEGIELDSQNAFLNIVGNIITGSGDDGIDIDTNGNFFSGLIAQNAITQSNDEGLELDAGTLDLILSENITNENGSQGIAISADNTVNPLLITLNTSNLNGNDGISVIFDGDLDSTVDIQMNTADLNGGDGISVVSNGMGDILGVINNNTTNGNDPGIFVQSNNAASDIFLDLVGNVANNNTQEGIRIDGAGNFTGLVEGNVASMNGDDGLQVYVDGGIDVNLIDNMFLDNGSDGAELYSANTDITGVLSGNTASGNGQGGLYMFSNADIALDVLNNTTNSNNAMSFDPHDAGISLVADGNVSGLVDGNTANNNGQYGIRIAADRDGNNVGDVTASVTNNTANLNGMANNEAGISIEGENVSLFNVEGNTTHENFGHGLSVVTQNNLEGAFIGNSSVNNGGRGISLEAGNNSTTQLNGNSSGDNGEQGIYISAVANTSTSMQSSSVGDNSAAGIEVTAGNDLFVNIDQSNSVANSGIGIRLQAGQDVLGNVTGNTADGIEIIAGRDITNLLGGDFFFSGNTTNGTSGDGVLMDAVRDLKVQIIGNTSSGNGGNGMNLLVGNNMSGTVSGNTFVDNTDDGFALVAVNDISAVFSGNESRVNDNGMYIEAGGNFTGDIINNTTDNNSLDGIHLEAVGSIQGLFPGAGVIGNTANGNGGDGIDIDAATIGTAMNSFIISGNTTGVAGMMGTGNGGEGIEIDSTGNVFITFTNNNSAFNNNGLQAIIDGNWTGNVSGNTALNSVVTNLFIGVIGDFTGDVTGNTANNSTNFGGLGIVATNFTGDVIGNTTNGNLEYGLGLVLSGNFTGNVGDAFLQSGNTANNNGADGIRITADGNFVGHFSDNTTNMNGGDGVFMDIDGAGSVTNLSAINNTSNNNGDDGFDTDAASFFGILNSSNTATGNTDQQFTNQGGNQIIIP